MRFFVSQEFIKEFEKLKKKRAKYNCIGKSLFKEFFNKSNEEINARGDFLSSSSSAVVIKKKRAQSCGDNGKSYGFRILSAVKIESETCGLFMIYPKWGPYAKQNALKDEWKPRLASYIKDQKKGDLLEMKFDAKKKEVYFEELSD